MSYLFVCFCHLVSLRVQFTAILCAQSVSVPGIMADDTHVYVSLASGNESFSSLENLELSISNGWPKTCQNGSMIKLTLSIWRHPVMSGRKTPASLINEPCITPSGSVNTPGLPSQDKWSAHICVSGCLTPSRPEASVVKTSTCYQNTCLCYTAFTLL